MNLQTFHVCGGLLSSLQHVCKNLATKNAERFVLTHISRWILAIKDLDHDF